MTDATPTPESTTLSVDDRPVMDVLQVVNTIPTATLDQAENPRDRMGVFLGMADLAFTDLIEAGGEPDTVSMALAPGTRESDGVPVIVATFSAFRPTETPQEPTA